MTLDVFRSTCSIAPTKSLSIVRAEWDPRRTAKMPIPHHRYFRLRPSFINHRSSIIVHQSSFLVLLPFPTLLRPFLSSWFPNKSVLAGFATSAVKLLRHGTPPFTVHFPTVYFPLFTLFSVFQKPLSTHQCGNRLSDLRLPPFQFLIPHSPFPIRILLRLLLHSCFPNKNAGSAPPRLGGKKNSACTIDSNSRNSTYPFLQTKQIPRKMNFTRQKTTFATCAISISQTMWVNEGKMFGPKTAFFPRVLHGHFPPRFRALHAKKTLRSLFISRKSAFRSPPRISRSTSHSPFPIAGSARLQCVIQVPNPGNFPPRCLVQSLELL